MRFAVVSAGLVAVALVAQGVKAPMEVISTATTIPAGRGFAFWAQVGQPGGNCDQPNPVANDFVAYYACLESGPGRSTAAGTVGLFGFNSVLTATFGHDIGMVGYESDIQNLTGEGVNVPQAWATNGKVGLGAVLASNASTSGDGSAGVAVTIAGSNLGDRWRYAVEAAGARTASFYARRQTPAGGVDPNIVLFNDTHAGTFLQTLGQHQKILDTATVDIWGTADGRIDISGLNPVMNMFEMDQPINGKVWRYQVAGGDFTIETVNDAYTFAARVLALRRNGEVNIPALAGAGTRPVCVTATGTLIPC